MNKVEKNIIRPLLILVGVALVTVPLFAEELPAAWWMKTLDVIAGLALVFYIILAFKRDSGITSDKTLTIRTDEGESSIAISALEGLLGDEIRKSGDVHDVDVELKVNDEDDSITCLLRFKLDSQPDIPKRIESHRKTVRAAFTRLIPNAISLDIICRVDGIVVPKKPEGDEKSSSSAAFSGPVYPVLPEDESAENY
ncbi:MAG: hypothetical protein JXA52_09000 [Planctomycetes bacterium]|nr:hypothetical protein [Planctomycetota bacterium]